MVRRKGKGGHRAGVQCTLVERTGDGYHGFMSNDVTTGSLLLNP